MVQRLDLASLSAPGDEGHSEAATDVPMQMSLVSISNLTGKVRSETQDLPQMLHKFPCSAGGIATSSLRKTAW